MKSGDSSGSILSWLPEWNERMQEYAITPGYKAIATLIYACCEDVLTFLMILF
jgi:hypothetical protein